MLKRRQSETIHARELAKLIGQSATDNFFRGEPPVGYSIEGQLEDGRLYRVTPHESHRDGYANWTVGPVGPLQVRRTPERLKHMSAIRAHLADMCVSNSDRDVIDFALRMAARDVAKRPTP